MCKVAGTRRAEGRDRVVKGLVGSADAGERSAEARIGLREARA